MIDVWEFECGERCDRESGFESLWRYFESDMQVVLFTADAFISISQNIEAANYGASAARPHQGDNKPIKS